jgi:hypothetical protein
MATQLSKSIYLWRNVRAALLGLAALGGASSPVFGQAAVAGKFTLTESTHLGSRILPAGSYKFTIEPVGISQTVDSIQGGRRPVLVVVKPGTSTGPVTGIFAMATRSDQALDRSQLVMDQGNDGMAIHTMYLDEQRLVLDFNWLSPKVKTKTPVLAEAARSGPAPAPKPAKATD